MAWTFLCVPRKLAGAEENYSLPGTKARDREVEQGCCGLRIPDAKPAALDDCLVAEVVPPLIATASEDAAKGCALEGWGSYGAAHADVDEQGRAKTPRRFNGVDNGYELGCRRAPAPIAPTEECQRVDATWSAEPTAVVRGC